MERTARGGCRRHPRPPGAGPPRRPGRHRRGLVRRRVPGRGVRSGDRFRRTHPGDAALRCRTSGAPHLTHLARRSARPPLDHGRRRRAAGRAADRRAPVDRLDAGRRARRPPGDRFCHRRRRALLDGVPGERGARPAARPSPGGRDDTTAARPHGRAAPPVAAYGLRGGPAGRCRAGRRGALQQPAGRRCRLVRRAPGGARFVRRGRAVRRLPVRGDLPGAARRPYPARAVATGGHAPSEERVGRRQGPHRRPPAAGARLRGGRRCGGRGGRRGGAARQGPRRWPRSVRADGGRADRRCRRRHPHGPRPAALPVPSAAAGPGDRLRRRRPAGRRPRSGRHHRAAAPRAGRSRRGRRGQHRAHAARPGDRGPPPDAHDRAPARGRPGLCGARRGRRARGGGGDRTAPPGERQVRLRARRRRVRPDAGRRAAAAGGRAGAGQGRRPFRRAAAARPAGRAARRRRPPADARDQRLLHRPGGWRRCGEVHPGRGTRRVDQEQGARGRADARARGDPGGQAPAVHPAGRLQCRSVAPRGGAAVRRRPRGARRHRGPARPGARCRGHLRPVHRLLGGLPGRRPRPVPDRDRPHQPLGDRRARSAPDRPAGRRAGGRA